MKKAIKILSALAAAALMAASFSGCDGGSSGSETIPAVTEASNPGSESADLHALLQINEKGNEFAGVWKITGGTGSQFKNFAFMFDGNDRSFLMIGNMGYLGTYTLKTEDLGNGAQKTMTTHLVFGIDGTYTYKFDSDMQGVTLTDTETGEETELTRTAAYEYIPFPDKEPVIDEELVGAWKDENGNSYYFDAGGVMLEYFSGLSFIFAKYSATGESLSYTYTMKDEINNESQYSVSGDVLTLDGIKYNRIPVDELSIKD